MHDKKIILIIVFELPQKQSCIQTQVKWDIECVKLGLFIANTTNIFCVIQIFFGNTKLYIIIYFIPKKFHFVTEVGNSITLRINTQQILKYLN